MDYPSHLQIETSTHCNGRCVFCYLPQMKRKGGTMTEDLFMKIMDDAKEIQKLSGLIWVGLFYLNEPLIVPNFFKYMDALRERGFRTVIFTNGQALTKEKAERLASYTDVIYWLTFSVAGIDMESCYRIMGLNYNTVKENIQYFLQVNQGKITVSINCPNCAVTKSFLDNETWREEWEKIIPAIQYGPFYNFAGMMHDEREIVENEYHEKRACARIQQLCLLWDGRAHLCCMDPEGKVILGDINKQSLLEIFNSETAVYYREMHNQGRWDELPLCKDCNVHIVGRG